jgi:hypothetical protein
MRSRWLERGGLASALFLVLLSSATPVRTAQAPDISFTRLILQGTTRVTRTVFDYVYKVEAENRGEGLLEVEATVESLDAATMVMDAQASFGAVASGAIAQSADTITLRQDRTRPFSLAALRWTFSGEAPTVPLPTVEIDPSVVPEFTELAGIGNEPPRPVAALTDDSGLLLHFVENELVVASDDPAALAALATRVGGRVVHSFDPRSLGIDLPVHHLIRLDPRAVNPSAVVSDLAALHPEASGDLRFSSEAGLRALAAAADEAAAGATIAINWISTPTEYVNRTTTESPSLSVCTGSEVPPGVGCVPGGIAPPPGAPSGTPVESFTTNAFLWSYMGTGPGTQNIGVGEAWRILHLAGRLGGPRFRMAFLDGGFWPSNDHPRPWTHIAAHDQPGTFPQNQLTCTGGQPCPWHGTNVVSAAMGVPDDGIGAAGPAGAVATPLTIEFTGDAFRTIQNWANAVASDARIISISISAPIPASVSFVAWPVNQFTALASFLGKLVVASAGNDNDDVDGEDCAAPFDFPCWEATWYSPCENEGVLCVGALGDNSTMRRASSNWGREEVDIFGPGNLWVGADFADNEPHLFGATSAATPFVAGVGALVMAANPSLPGKAVEDILIQSANLSPDTRVIRYVNAQAAVLTALTGQPLCLLPETTTLTPPHETAPCLRNSFSVELAQNRAVGPFQYQWRHYVGNNPVPLADGGPIRGSQTNSLVIDPFGAEHVGAYDVVVTNPCGSVSSGLTAVMLAKGVAQQTSGLFEDRAHHALSYDRQRARLVLHGGRSGLQVKNDTLERDAAGSWHLVTNQGPPARYGHAMAYDEARGVTVLFGGFLCDSQLCSPGGGPLYYGDTWEWDGTTWTERAVPGPGPRWLHAMAYDPIRERVVLHGGRHPFGQQLMDLWEWDGASWTMRGTVGDPNPGPTGDPLGQPRPRESHGLAFDRVRDVLVLHGGQLFIGPGSNARGGETWELDTADQWLLRAVSPGSPNGLFLPDHRSMTFDLHRGTTVLLTHRTPEGALNGQLWDWKGGTEWTPIGNLPFRTNAAMAYDEARRRTVIVGGEGRSDTWEWRYVDPIPSGSCPLP